MIASCRPSWRNCALHNDAKMETIDAMEDSLAPLSANAVQIRQLITSLELCHHKAERWVHNIIEAIGSGPTGKGLGTRPPGELHAAEQVWQNACTVLDAWCAGNPDSQTDMTIGDIPASQLLAGLGEQTPLKQWQVQRVIERIRSHIHWPPSLDDPAAQYQWLLLTGDDYELDYFEACPAYYQDHADYWLATVQTIIHDTDQAEPAELSLAIAIDLLMPCHWDFIGNLQLVLAAIGGQLHPSRPFAACGRNITLVPIRSRMQRVCYTLQVFCAESISNQQADTRLLDLLGKSSAEKKWLAACLDKTIRLQLDPPADLQSVSAMTGPDWLRQ